MEAAAESSREAVLKQLLTKRLRIQVERKRPAEIFCLDRKEEYKKGFRFDQNILLNIPVTRARSKEGRDCSERDSKPMHLKFTWSTSFSRKEVLLY
ncbi:hypothetical protein V6N11_075436 [Hibiscus sabdariffa]|uniref:Uncharacterized protein n=1 Tax=Hibiscus sabdariffa TaxID=183260 RepID=A0ABR2R6H2_9ROSI